MYLATPDENMFSEHMQTDGKSPDQTVQMCCLIRVFAVTFRIMSSMNSRCRGQTIDAQADLEFYYLYVPQDPLFI